MQRSTRGGETYRWELEPEPERACLASRVWALFTRLLAIDNKYRFRHAPCKLHGGRYLSYDRHCRKSQNWYTVCQTSNVEYWIINVIV